MKTLPYRHDISLQSDFFSPDLFSRERIPLMFASLFPAFLPESDSEDELPPGWEERATIQGTHVVASSKKYVDIVNVCLLQFDTFFFRILRKIREKKL